MNENLNSQMSFQQQGKLYGASGKVAPEMDALAVELEKLVDSNLKPSLTTTDQQLASSPQAFLGHAKHMLDRARFALIKAEAIYQAKRDREVIVIRDRLAQMDREHQKVVSDLSSVIARLEACQPS